MSRTGSHLCLWAGVQKPQQGPPSPQGQKLAVTAGVALAIAAPDERTVLVNPKAPASDATAASARPSSSVRKMLRPPWGVSQPHVSHIIKSSFQGVLMRNRTIVSSRGKSPRAKRVVLPPSIWAVLASNPAPRVLVSTTPSSARRACPVRAPVERRGDHRRVSPGPELLEPAVVNWFVGPR